MTSLHLCITFMHLADAFYPKRLTVHSGYTFFFWSVCVFPGDIRRRTFYGVIMDYWLLIIDIFARRNGLKLKCLNDRFVSYKQAYFCSQDVNWWTHSDGTHSLQSIHCWTSDVMLGFSNFLHRENAHTSHSRNVAYYHTTLTVSALYSMCTVNSVLDFKPFLLNDCCTPFVVLNFLHDKVMWQCSILLFILVKDSQSEGVFLGIGKPKIMVFIACWILKVALRLFHRQVNGWPSWMDPDSAQVQFSICSSSTL